MNIADIITLVGTVGGIQGLVEIGKWWQNRKIDRRKEEAYVKATENQVTRSQIDWLEKRLAERDAKIDAIYAELRKEQTLHIGEIHRRHEAELRLAEAEAWKCLIRGCPQRQPPSEY
ncbi:MAG: hypothetical protein K2N35_12765 [Muribaculaceae bacterium]|nr:hypothetical protein [Muribaculaceae bacterium]